MRRLAVGMAVLAFVGVALSWAIADDKEIAKEITERLKREQDAGNMEGFDIQLKVAEGHVLLKGHVSTPEQQELALDIARRAEGVKRVVNDLEVPGSEPITASDPPAAADKKDAATLDDATVAAVLAQSLRKLKDSGDLKGFRIDFDVTDGIVVMNGTVSSDEQRDLAVRTAKSTAGVKSVADDLAVRTAPAETAPSQTPTMSDSDIAQQIAGVLKEHKADGKLKCFSVDLSVENGVVVYEGRVASAQQLDAVLDIARQADGVRDIVNHLVIAQPQRELVAETDENLEAEAEEALLSNPGFVNRLVSASTDLQRPEGEAETAEYTPTPAEPVVEAVNAVYQPEATITPELVVQDQQIGETLIQKLRQANQQGGLRGFGIGVHVTDGTVRLVGRVSSPEQQQMALEIARRIRGVRLVVNELTIVEPPASEAKAEAIASETEDDKDDNLANVEVSTKAIVDASPAIAGTAPPRPSISQPARLGIVPNAPAFPVRIGSAGNLPPVAPTAAYVPYPTAQPVPAAFATANQTPRPLGLPRLVSYPAAVLAAPLAAVGQATGAMPAHLPGPGHATVPARYDHPNLPGYAWPSYSAHPNYGSLTYPKQYSPTAWPYIGPFYPYPQVPLGWRRVELKWDDGWWQMNFKAKKPEIARWLGKSGTSARLCLAEVFFLVQQVTPYFRNSTSFRNHPKNPQVSPKLTRYLFSDAGFANIKGRIYVAHDAK